MNNVTLYQNKPTGLPGGQTQAAFNNSYARALAAGDPRYQLKELDRPGISRGQGAYNQAGIRASQAMVDGISDAYSQDLQARQYNSNLALRNQAAQQQYGQALAGLQQQDRYATQMAALQRQNALIGLMGSFLG